MAPRRRGALVVLFLVILGVAALRDLARLGENAPWRRMDDFPDFYCAGTALDARESPYTYEPLHGCEHRVNAGRGFRGKVFAANPNLAVPAPQPPFDFLAFMALARLSFEPARALYALAIVVAVGSCVVAMAALGVPWTLACAAFLLSAGYVELNTGQIVPFALLAVVLCGLALARGRDATAGMLAVCATIEPTVGLPVALSTFLFVPKARCTIALAVAAFAVASLALVGASGIRTYIAGVLPAHSASELHFPFQYSLTYLAGYAGFSPQISRIAGALSYVLLLGVGLWIAPRAYATLSRRELLVFVPALCAVTAGPFLHQEELCFALPALLALSVSIRGAGRTILAIALCALSIPWILVWGMKGLFLISLFVCAVILLGLRVERWTAAVVFCAAALLMYAFELHPPHLPTPAAMSQRYAGDDLVQAVWSEYTAARASSDPLWVWIKVPSWAALMAAIAVAARSSQRAPA